MASEHSLGQKESVKKKLFLHRLKSLFYSSRTLKHTTSHLGQIKGIFQSYTV